MSRKLIAWISGGAALAAVLAVCAVALWPASETEQARNDGEAFGTAVVDLQSATTPLEVDAALLDVRDALNQTAEHASDEVAEQANDQADALERAADGFVGEREADNEFDQDLYHLQLEAAVDDLATNAEDFRTQGPEVQQAFWDGYQKAIA